MPSVDSSSDICLLDRGDLLLGVGEIGEGLGELGVEARAVRGERVQLLAHLLELGVAELRVAGRGLGRD